MLQFIVSIIVFFVTTWVGGFLGSFIGEELVIVGLLGVILVNLLLSASVVSDLKKEVAELKNMLKEKEIKPEENKSEESKPEEKTTEDK